MATAQKNETCTKREIIRRNKLLSKSHITNHQITNAFEDMWTRIPRDVLVASIPALANQELFIVHLLAQNYDSKPGMERKPPWICTCLR